ncbi:MAG: hypothetical protein QOE28_40 [Solirubrobacteraceae bacterium]|jgi:hypothetical protein|nr:hypothetical protein [Solirubrobacteraceae bacterium]
MGVERSWAAAVRDFWPVAFVLALCPVVSLLAPGPAEPVARMHSLIDAERSLGLLFEPAMHRWTSAHPPLLAAGQVAYVAAHVPVLLAVLLWIWLTRRHAFALVRNAFVATQSIALAGYLLFPTAPPRMIPGLGYEDVATTGTHGLERLAMSPYAAMPSGHAAFALLVAGSVFALARSRAVRAAALVYPLVVFSEIVATGNHLWLDAAAGAAVAAAGVAIALAIAQAPQRALRPQRAD